ncbi:GntR family transcriptional regulator [Alicyclobacillus sp. SO9]|uniref:GntR family transcriptional regulator n=1 Tax=Alicyclobacillus sp. SO9 TaxID=2665646 RepID=UPI0018E82B8B|nr:GntR family transcriptional regulator [Alicyclobacillus sp. SO9]
MGKDAGGLFDEDFRPLEVRVYQILREQILLGELKAGERLIERELAERLRISRTPVREALRKLDSEGFIEIIPRRGGIVVELTDKDILDMFRILETLEVLAVRQAAERITPSQQDMLNQIDVTDASQMIAAICEVAKNKKLTDMLRSLLDMIRATARLGREQPGRAEEAAHEHREIIKAVQAGDGDAAEEYIHLHVQQSVNAYRHQLKKQS